MNKYLMLSATALIASTMGASAGSSEFTFGTSGGGAYCDGGHVVWVNIVYAWQHTNNNCASGVSTGQGLLSKVKGLGRIVELSDNYFGDDREIAFNYVVHKGAKLGSQWLLWVEFSGVSSFEGNSGILLPPPTGNL